MEEILGFIAGNTMILWLILFILFAIIEAVTLDLTSIWFSFGALIALIVSAFVNNLAVQVIVFSLFSILFLFLLKPLTKKFLLKNKIDTNIKVIIGKHVNVIEEINDEDGAIKVEGKVWTAKNVEEGEVILKGEKVEILEIKGSKVIVKKIKEMI